MKKRLMIVIWNMGAGGVQKRVRDILIDISKNHTDWHVDLLVKYYQESPYVDAIARLRNVDIHYFAPSLNQSKTPLVVLWVARKYLAIKPQVCLTFLDYLSIIMVCIRAIFFWHETRLVLNEAAVTSRFLEINRIFFWKILVGALYKYADVIIVPSAAGQEDLVANFSVPAEKIVKIHNWTLFFEKKQYRRPAYDVLYVGRLEEEKNPFLFLDIVRKIKQTMQNISGCIVGDGRLMQQVTQYIAQHELTKSVQLVGHQADVGAFMRNAKILILPSRNEGMPNVVLEAARYTIPTISLDFLGASEVIQDGKTGQICTSSEEVVARTIELLQRPRRRKVLGIAAKLYVRENFSIKNQKRFIAVLLGVSH